MRVPEHIEKAIKSAASHSRGASKGEDILFGWLKAKGVDTEDSELLGMYGDCISNGSDQAKTFINYLKGR